MFIVDAQVHIWGADTPQRPWPSRHKPHRPQPVTKEILLAEMDAAGVQRAVIVPPSWEGDRNDLALEAAALYPDRLAVMGRMAVEDPLARNQIDQWKSQPGMLGIRITLHTPAFEPLLTTGKLDWLWPAAERAGIPLAIYIGSQLLPEIGKVARRHPDLRIAVDHLALPMGITGVGAFAGLDRVIALAPLANVAVKVSALPCHSAQAYPYRDLHPYLQRVYDAFGPRRMFWGSDLSRLPCSYRQALTLFTEELSWLSPADQEWIMGRAVCEWLGWPCK